MAKVITASTIAWSDSTPFQGLLVLAFVTPVLGASNYPEIYPRLPSGARALPKPLPQRMSIPIVNGALHDNFIFKESQLDPPNVRYFDFWLDSNGALIAIGGGLLVIDVDEYTLSVPTLTTPTAETSSPSLSSLPTDNVVNQLDITQVTSEVPSGTIDGVNTTFTISREPSAALLIYLGPFKLNEGTDYTRTGTTIEFANPPQVGDDIEAYIF